MESCEPARPGHIRKEVVMSDDHSPGDARKPYSDQGGPEARHAETHDVRREELTNPTGAEPVDESFAEDLAPESPESIRLAQLEATPGNEDKHLADAFPELNQGDLAQLALLAPGTPLEQGSVYLDLNNRAAGPFKAIGGQEVGNSQHIIAKKTTSYELWNRVAGIDDSPGAG
jgi:hypothetical protein